MKLFTGDNYAVAALHSWNFEDETPVRRRDYVAVELSLRWSFLCGGALLAVELSLRWSYELRDIELHSIVLFVTSHLHTFDEPREIEYHRSRCLFSVPRFREHLAGYLAGFLRIEEATTSLRHALQ